MSVVALTHGLGGEVAGRLRPRPGVTREMLGVVIRDLEGRRLIRRDDAVIEIVDRAGLLALLRHEIDAGTELDDDEPAGTPVPMGVGTPP